MKSQGKEKFLTKTRVAVLVLITAIIIALGAIYQSLNSTKQTQTSEGAELGFSQGNDNENSNESQDEVEKGKVYVRYLNEEGTEIATTDVLEGEIGTQYTTTRKQIGHYVSNGYDPMNRIGDYKSEDITVVYLYKFVDNAVSVTEEDNVITLNVQNTLEENEYKLILEQKNTDGQNLTGGKFSMYDVEELPNKIEGTTNNGRLTLGAVTVANEKNSEIILNEQEAPKGYLKGLKDSGASVTLLRSYNNENSSYELTATSNDVELEVEENTANREIVLKVVNERIKTYDLAVKKFASSIDGTETTRNIAARVDNEGNIVYDNTAATLNVRDFEKIVYKIRVYNEGNQSMAAPVITEVLPSGLKFLPESTINTTNGWTVEEGTLKTSKLVGQTIAGIDTASETTVNYLEVQLEVEVEEDNASTTSTELTNETTIPTDEREISAENNNATETVNLVRITPTYDLAVKKFASKINGTDTGRSVTATLNNLNQIVYEENNAEKTISHGQTIEYTIRVYGEGNRDVHCTKLTDVIPAGLNFDANNATNSQYGWTKNGNNLETSALVGQTITGIKTYKGELPQYKEVKLVLTLDEDNVPAEETTILNTASAAQATNETDTTDNTDTDEVNLSRTPKTYDLAVKVFASTIDGGSTSRNVTVGLNETNQIVYNEVRPAKSVKDEQRVVYTIRVFNEGTGTVNGTKLTDVVPAGLRFVEDSTINTLYGWTKNGNNVETTYLESQEIRGANLRRSEVPAYKEVQVEFEVVEDDTADEVNKITNTVRIAKVANETDESDNENSDELDLTRREKIYDLAIKKFASEIDGTATGRNVTVSLNSENEIQYTETRPEKVVTEGQKIKYTIRVYNEGNQTISSVKVTENIPTGLKFVENSQINTANGWTKNGNNIETTVTNITGVRIDKGETPTYKDVYVELEATREGLDREQHTLTNTVQLETVSNETDTEDNTTTDTVILDSKPVYDVAVKKFVSKIDGEATGRNVTVSKNSNNEVVFNEVGTEKTVTDDQIVEYTIRVFNIGEVNAEGTKVTEIIPAGLTYLTNSQLNTENAWSEVEGGLETSKIVGQTIQPLHYLDIKVEFKVNEDSANENNKITNTASIVASERDENSENNTDSETASLQRKVKTYDLAMKKFAYSVDGENLDKEITASINDNNQIVYANENTKTTVVTGQKIVFTLRIFNEGNQAMAGKVVTDVIPEGLQYVANSTINETYGWTVNNGVATTNYLVGQTIDGFEAENNEQPKYKDVQIECEVVAEPGIVDKEMSNIARVESSDNETDTEDNEGEAIAVIRKQLPKVSDLSMKKFLYSVDGTVLSNKEVKANNINGEIKYTQEDSSVYKVSNNQKVVFTLRVYNLGNGATLGRAVIENIPDGFKFDSDSEINIANNWKMYKKDRAGNLVETTNVNEAKVLKSEKLLDETIGGFEVANNELPKYKDVKIEFVVDEENVKTEDRIVTNTARVETSRLEPNSDNDSDEEKVQVKVFDLNVTKYIKEITIKNSTAEKTYPLGLDKKGHLFKAEVKKDKVNETEVLVTYGLRVKNVGEIAGYATELTDYIPDDFELVETNGWKVDGKTAKTKVISKKLIEPGDYTTVEISFKWKLNENNLGLRDNVAVISASTNDYLAKDRVPDKDNNEKFIISLATGTAKISVIVILGVLVAIAIVIKAKQINFGKRESDEKK